MPDDVAQLVSDYSNLSEQGKAYIRQTMDMVLGTYKKPISILGLAEGDTEIAADISSYADERLLEKRAKERLQVLRDTKEA